MFFKLKFFLIIRNYKKIPNCEFFNANCFYDNDMIYNISLIGDDYMVYDKNLINDNDMIYDNALINDKIRLKYMIMP